MSRMGPARPHTPVMCRPRHARIFAKRDDTAWGWVGAGVGCDGAARNSTIVSGNTCHVLQQPGALHRSITILHYPTPPGNTRPRATTRPNLCRPRPPTPPRGVLRAGGEPTHGPNNPTYAPTATVTIISPSAINIRSVGQAIALN